MGTVLITGGHKGIGLEATRKILEQGGFDLIMAGRNRAEVDAVARDLASRYRTRIETVAIDIASLASVREAALAVRTMTREGVVAPLQVLMLNAGAQFMGAPQYTGDGLEKTFATNCLGHFLLLNLLLDDVQDRGRVVFTASGTHDPDTMDGRMVGKAAEPDATRLATDGKDGKALQWGVRYSTSKLCTILYAYELDRRLRARGSSVQSIALDPGLIVETGLSRSAPMIAQRLTRTSFAKWLFRMLGVTMGSLPFSGDALARVATDPAFADASGKYIQSNNGRLIEARSSAMSYDVGRARKLWADSDRLVGLNAQ
ncbi:SDR family NAD(P)-dependent oxidoreductase [Lichenihabitans sp. PAMC28606]|uniref:SDR family NAD(P)-dependent oxidoreductase n=1 Tax=Lichenihabitans sp. PAMC28606 TaxID=2880932 RepID=UPI001D0AE8B3|nr:SDR family NAD(P)-dependent oxidoreductase [Lichenihabitans sp. PAMC28606]UDL96250.1 SDR family NAD(P)-dependent oxidoreductase [Lichenihabitans sp. PAMC28606]